MVWKHYFTPWCRFRTTKKKRHQYLFSHHGLDLKPRKKKKKKKKASILVRLVYKVKSDFGILFCMLVWSFFLFFFFLQFSKSKREMDLPASTCPIINLSCDTLSFSLFMSLFTDLPFISQAFGFSKSNSLFIFCWSKFYLFKAKTFLYFSTACGAATKSKNE